MFEQRRAPAHFKIGEIKSGGHGASDKRKSAVGVWMRAEPMARRNYMLQFVSAFYLWPQRDAFRRAVGSDLRKRERSSQIKGPHLIGFQAMQF